MKKIKQGDSVIVIAGKDKGKRGKVTAILDKVNKVLVENINLVSKHVKANPHANQEGAIIKKAMPIHRSNVMHYDETSQKRSRVRIKQLEDGSRKRVYATSNEFIDSNS